jgi:catechol 2,3-dioxygenase-like lactoylglutathione lyase family enzyme
MLEDSPLVMVWRRVADLNRAKSIVSEIHSWPVIGEDAYSVMYDGGGALVGLWVQDEPLLLADDACSGLSFIRYLMVSNPASELVVAPRQFRMAVTKLRGGENWTAVPNVFTAVSRTEDGAALRILDEDGNVSSLLEPSPRLLKAATGSNWGWVTNDRQGSEVGSPVVGHRRLVSNLEESRTFYGEVLGLRPIDDRREEVLLDANGLMLSLQQQPQPGLVELLREQRRLLGDWLVFHVSNIKAAYDGLVERGVEFRQGIETSGIGHMAHFEDPDGHSLVIWEPSKKPTKGQPINFYPQLNRLLSRTH